MTLGFVAVRLRVLEPERGDMAAMSFYTGNVGLPLLVFRAVATANLGGVKYGVLIACTLAKVFVMGVTWAVTYLAYRPRTTTKKQRFLSATVFSLATTLTNDFALGIPVIESLYGFSMTAYITANAVIGSMLFVPVGSVLLAVGASMDKSAGEDEEDGEGASAGTPPSAVARVRSGCVWLLCIVRDAFKSYVIISAIAGLLFKLAFSWLLEETETGLKLPGLLARIVDLFTQPFAMLSLFQTGTALRSAKLSLWPLALTLMKVVVCAFISYQLSTMLTTGVSDQKERDDLNNFSFFYGTIPASAAPIILGSKFAPGAIELLAMAILTMLFASGAIMYMFAVFQAVSSGAFSLVATVATVQLAISSVSVICMTALLVLLAVCHRHWGWNRPGKLLVAAYGLSVLAFQILMLVFSRHAVMGKLCDRSNACLYFLKAVGFSQNCARLLLVCGQACLCFIWGTKQRSKVDEGSSGYVMLAAVLVVSGALAWLVQPNAVNEVCQAHTHRWVLTRTEVRYVHDLDCILIAIMAVLGVAGLVVRRRRVWKNSMSQGSAPQAAGAGESAVVGVPELTASSSIAGGESSSASGNSGEEDTAVEQESSATVPHAEDKEVSRVFKQEFRCHALAWKESPPRNIIKLLVLVQAIQLIMQTINSLQALHPGISGTGFSTMLILEYTLVHGQGLFLLLALFLDARFAALLGSIVRRNIVQIQRATPEEGTYKCIQEMDIERYAASRRILIASRTCGTLRVGSASTMASASLGAGSLTASI